MFACGMFCVVLGVTDLKVVKFYSYPCLSLSYFYIVKFSIEIYINFNITGEIFYYKRKFMIVL